MSGEHSGERIAAISSWVHTEDRPPVFRIVAVQPIAHDDVTEAAEAQQSVLVARIHTDPGTVVVFSDNANGYDLKALIFFHIHVIQGFHVFVGASSAASRRGATPCIVRRESTAGCSAASGLMLSWLAMETKLIAHRGGVVHAPSDENSIRAAEEAAVRGYHGIEIDVRETRDGVLVLHHNARTDDAFGLDEPIERLDYDDIRRAARSAGLKPPPTLEDIAERCAGRLRLMVEIKLREPPERFLKRVETVLTAYGLLDGMLVIGSSAGKAYFHDKAKTGIRKDEFLRSVHEEVERHPESASGSAGASACRSPGLRVSHLSRTRFLFDHGNVLQPEDVVKALSVGVEVVPSINVFHYRDEDPHAGARRDARKLLDAGVEVFQIDSVFEAYFQA